MEEKLAVRRTVEHFLTVFSSGDVESTLSLMADDASWWVAGSIPISGTYSKEEFLKLLSGIADS